MTQEDTTTGAGDAASRPGVIALAAEYAMRTVPDRVEVCRRCVGGLIHRLGPALAPYCPKCGATEPGVLYQRAGR